MSVPARLVLMGEDPGRGDPPDLDEDDGPAVERPLTRAGCADVPRPCPFVSCRHHLYLDVNHVGQIKYNFPDVEPGNLAHSCSLDEAEAGGLALEGVAERMGFTRERARQLEASGLSKIRADGAVFRTLADCRPTASLRHHMTELDD